MAWQPKDLMDIKRDFVALALQEGVSPRMLPPQAVRARMVARGARYAE